MDGTFIVLATTTGEWVSRGVHLFAAMIAVGGFVLQRVAVRPALEEAGESPVREGIRRRWSPVTHVVITLLLATGIYQLMTAGLSKGETEPSYHMWFGIKLLAALGVFFIASALAGRSRALSGIRAKARTWLSLAILLSIGIIAISLYLRSIEAVG